MINQTLALGCSFKSQNLQV